MSCKDCKWFFPLEEDPSRGDCVRREGDEKSEYYTAKPCNADDAACDNFVKK
jgi:hypothetical protein